MIPYGYVYKTENLITTDTYIGQTTKIGNKAKYYLGSGKYFKRALSKYGSKSFTKEILCYCTSKEELDSKERLYIALLKPTYNIALGGRTVGQHSSESKIKMGLARKGVVSSKETREKISLANIGKEENYRHRMKISLALKGIKRSEETKVKISLARKGIEGRQLTDSEKEHLMYVHLGEEHKYCRKSVICVETGTIYNSITDASMFARGEPRDMGNITKCCKGKSRSAYGYHWKYTDKEKV